MSVFLVYQNARKVPCLQQLRRRNRSSRGLGICVVSDEGDSRPTMRTFKSYVVFFGCLVSVSSSALAEWQRLSGEQSNGRQLFMDPQSVKQAGPMAIYRQVLVLSQGPDLLAPTAASTVTLYEYDCVSFRARVLRVMGFDQPWAAGNALTSPSPSAAAAEWHTPAEASLAGPMIDALCPRGDD